MCDLKVYISDFFTKYGLSQSLSQSRFDRQGFFGDKTGEAKAPVCDLKSSIAYEELPQKEERIKITEWRGGRV